MKLNRSEREIIVAALRKTAKETCDSIPCGCKGSGPEDILNLARKVQVINFYDDLISKVAGNGKVSGKGLAKVSRRKDSAKTCAGIERESDRARENRRNGGIG